MNDKTSGEQNPEQSLLHEQEEIQNILAQHEALDLESKALEEKQSVLDERTRNKQEKLARRMEYYDTGISELQEMAVKIMNEFDQAFSDAHNRSYELNESIIAMDEQLEAVGKEEEELLREVGPKNEALQGFERPLKEQKQWRELKCSWACRFEEAHGQYLKTMEALIKERQQELDASIKLFESYVQKLRRM